MEVDAFLLGGKGAGLRTGGFQENKASNSWRISDKGSAILEAMSVTNFKFEAQVRASC